MGRDGVTVGEGAIIGRNHPTIGQQNGIALNSPHFDEFAIDKSLASRVSLQQQFVPGGNFQFPFFPHIKRGEASTQLKKTFRVIVTSFSTATTATVSSLAKSEFRR